MRVLQVVPALEAGGVTKGTLEITAALIAVGAEAHIACDGGAFAAEAARLGAILHPIPAAKKGLLAYFKCRARLWAIIKAHSIDIVHARSRFPAWPAHAAARGRSVPFVTTYHGSYGGMNWAPKRFYNSIMARGDRVIAISDFIARYIQQHHPQCDKKHIISIPRGVDPNKYDINHSIEHNQGLWHKWSVENHHFLFVLPGRLTRWKGHTDALLALALILPEHPDARLLFIGDAQGRSDYMAELRGLAGRLGVAHAVLFAPPSADMNAVYAAADCILVPSTKPEAFGRVPIEAGAAGRLVIASGHGGAAETVRDGVTGLHHVPRDPCSLAHAMHRALSMPPSERQAMGNAARQHVITCYTIAQMQQRTLDVYRSLLREPRQPARENP